MKRILTILLVCLSFALFSQTIFDPAQIGQTGRNQCTSRGFWVKSDTALFTSKFWIPNGAGAGLVLASDANGFATWQSMSGLDTNAVSIDSLPYWGLNGNTGTNPATNFIGTTDGQPLRIKSDSLITFDTKQFEVAVPNGADTTKLVVGIIDVGVPVNGASLGISDNANGTNAAVGVIDGSALGIGTAVFSIVSTLRHEAALFIDTSNINMSLVSNNSDTSSSIEFSDVAISLSRSIASQNTVSYITVSDSKIQLGSKDSSNAVRSFEANNGGGTQAGKLLWNTPSYTFFVPDTDGTANQVLATDGAGNGFWQSGGWSLTGNAGTNHSNNFLGTTDSVGVYVASGGNPENNNESSYLFLKQGDSVSEASFLLYARDTLRNFESTIAFQGNHGYIRTANIVGDSLTEINLSSDSIDVFFRKDDGFGGGSTRPFVIYPEAIKIDIPSKGTGKVLTSDAYGLASWQGGIIYDSLTSLTGDTITLTNNSTYIIAASGTITDVTWSFPTGNTGDVLDIENMNVIVTLNITGVGTGTITAAKITNSKTAGLKTFHNYGGNWY